MKIAKSDAQKQNVSASKYADGRKYIQAAIESLGQHADDPKARDAIANLGVVFLDLDA